MQPTPILIVGDAPSAQSGLGRIVRDLAVRLHENCSDVYRVGTYGYGGPGSRELAFPQYHVTEMKDWYLPGLQDVWEDFAGQYQPGVIFTIWDLSRLLWFTRPEHCTEPRMRRWLEQKLFKRWGYLPIDAYGPHKRLSVMQRECLAGFDSIVSYSKWSEAMTRETLGEDEMARVGAGAIPHGIDTKVFNRKDRAKSRRVFHENMGFKGPEIEDGHVLVGIVATNQARKDYGLAMQVCAELAKTMPVRVFIQTDVLERFWSIPALLHDFGLLPNAIVNCGIITDEMMAHIYTACDVTLGVGLGEGYGYSTFESLACGTPHVTGSYGGHAEHMDAKLLIEPIAYRYEGLYNCRRPVYNPIQWANAVKKALGSTVALPKELAWPNLWPVWEKWFRAQHQSLHQKVATPANHDSSARTRKGEATRTLSIVSPAENESELGRASAASSIG